MNNQSVAVIELHSEQKPTLYLCHVVNDELVVQQRSLYNKSVTLESLVSAPLPKGTYTPSYKCLPLSGAFFPHPLVECLPGGSKLA